MPVVTKRNSYAEMPKYQYKLNEHHKGADNACINGVSLSRNWKTFFNYKSEIEHLVRTFNKQDNPIDFQVLDPITKDSVLSSDIDYTQKRDIYTRKILSTFDRKTIEKLSYSWLINPVKKRTEWLIDMILKAQSAYIEYLESTNNEIDEDEIDENEPVFEDDGEIQSDETITNKLYFDYDDEEKDEIIIGVDTGRGDSKSVTDTILKKEKEDK